MVQRRGDQLPADFVDDRPGLLVLAEEEPAAGHGQEQLGPAGGIGLDRPAALLPRGRGGRLAADQLDDLPKDAADLVAQAQLAQAPQRLLEEQLDRNQALVVVRIVLYLKG